MLKWQANTRWELRVPRITTGCHLRRKFSVSATVWKQRNGSVYSFAGGTILISWINLKGLWRGRSKIWFVVDLLEAVVCCRWRLHDNAETCCSWNCLWEKHGVWTLLTDPKQQIVLLLLITFYFVRTVVYQSAMCSNKWQARSDWWRLGRMGQLEWVQQVLWCRSCHQRKKLRFSNSCLWRKVLCWRKKKIQNM